MVYIFLRILGITITILSLLALMIMGSSHPLVLALIIMAITILVGAVASSIVSFWVLLALLLVFLGGIMVIFSYITTLARNDKMFITPINPLLVFALGLGGVYFLLTKDTPINYFHLGLIYSSTRGNLIIFLTAYLLLSLLAIVKITQFHKGALTTWK